LERLSSPPALTLVPLDVLQWRRPGFRRFEVTTEPAGERNVSTGLIARHCKFKLAIRTFRRCRPDVKCDARIAYEEKSLSILLCQRPSLRKCPLGIRPRGDQVRIVFFAIEQTHARQHVT
jgi:hypothetical protein